MEVAVKYSNNFKIKFDGQLVQIDANILVSSLIHTTSVIQEINQFLDSGKKIEIKVKAPEKGSFLIQLNLIETVVETLSNIFTKENIGVAASIIGILVGLIELKKFLKGKKPKEVKQEGDVTIITNQEGNVINIDNRTFNIYNKSSVVNDALSQNFESIQNDPAITAFEITDINEKSYIRVNRDEFEYLSIKSEEISEGERIITEAATLNIVRLSFEESLKWDFYYKGNRISAKIKDPDFYNLIDKGESFAKGDTLEVELETTQKWDESVNTFINKSYQILKINRHIMRGEQQKFEFDDNLENQI
ncbi:hypothetical protein D9V86_01775 [Bacteroidetes/Chlorobi group bacterium ChocPot_Mid]|jgi:hypothetical protein|nr:MAG: hypothetical protein D9V86_01775 [Bacteroidetes/Chlorobi group bacterium ChocPot_Mid]